MKIFLGAVALLVGTIVSSASLAQAPAGATGQCKDNTYTTAAKKWQACAGHKGVQTWFADKTAAGAPAPAATSTTAAAPASAAAAKPAAAPASAAAPAAPAKTADTSAAATKSASAAARTTAAPGGGPGMVWVNTATNVYHCPGGTFYGKTKEGKYMTEADAKTAGARPDRGKACGK